MSMNTQVLIPNKPNVKHIRVETESEQGVYWGFMHASDEQRARPCCTLAIIEEGIALQAYIARQQMLRHSGGNGGIGYFVLGSDAPVFSLGGDLALFAAAIRAGDRQKLLDYALCCADGAHGLQSIGDGSVQSIALVQGDALGGGFEIALACNMIVAEEGVTMGFPEALFGLFPGMGAYSFLRRRVPAHKAQRMILDAHLYTADELQAMGIVDVVVPRGTGIEAVEGLIHQRRRSAHAYLAVAKFHQRYEAVPLDELRDITTDWVDTALKLSEKSLQTMERILRAQSRRFDVETRTPRVAESQV
jgi:DSF synthase